MTEIALCVLLVVLMAATAPSFKRWGVRGMVLVAMLAALASAGRAALQMIPSVQPASFIIILCGMAMGAGPGLYCGVLTAVISSFLTSIGPWSVWQALLWGLMGGLAALIRSWPVWAKSLYGLGWGFVFGWVMNLWYYTMDILPFTWGTFLTACVASFPMDLAHGVCNFALLLALSTGGLKLVGYLLVHGQGGEDKQED